MGQRPQTLYGFADSPIALAAYMIDHGDGGGQPAAAVAEALKRTSSPEGELTRDEILDNITLYWLTNTGMSAARLYWEYKGGFFNVKGVKIPVAVTMTTTSWSRNVSRLDRKRDSKAPGSSGSSYRSSGGTIWAFRRSRTVNMKSSPRLH